MKKLWKRAGALVLAGAMCAGLFGCGDKKKEQSKLLAEELGFGYLSTYQDLDVQMEYIHSVVSANGKAYLQGYYYDENDYEVSGERFYELDLATGKTTQMPLPELERSESSTENIQTMTMCPDGSGYWMITNIYTYSPVEGDLSDGDLIEPRGEEALPEDMPGDDAAETPADDEALSGGYQLDLLAAAVPVVVDAPEAEADVADEPEGNADMDSAMEDMLDSSAYGENQDHYLAKKFDMDGNLLQEIDLDVLAKDAEWFYCQNAAQDSQGNLYVAYDGTDGSKIAAFDKDGKQLPDMGLKVRYVESMGTGGNGAVLMTFYQEEGGMAFATLENGSASAPVRPDGIGETASLTIYGGEENSVFFSDGNLLYSMDLKTGETKKLLSWLDSDIVASNISGLVGTEDSLTVVLQSDPDHNGGYTFETGTLTKTPAEELPQRTVLTLGAEYLDEQVRTAVVDFNRKSDTYRITLVDYSSYNTTEDYNLGGKQLDMDVISGAGPDIISLGSGNKDKYIAKGVLLDLNEFLEKDETASRENLLDGPMKSYERDGKLYGIPYSATVQTIYGSLELLGDRERWNLQEMAEVVDGLPEDVDIFDNFTRSDFLTYMVYMNMSSFVDYEKAECSFDTEEFKSLLELAKKMPEDHDEEENGGTVMVEEAGVYMDDMQRVQQGELLLSNGGVSGEYDLKNFLKLYVKENGIIPIGFPTAEGNGAVLSVYGGLAISAKCGAKEGAWEFIKSTLTDEFQASMWSLPVTESAFDAMIEEAREPDYYIQDGEKVYQEPVSYIGETEYKLGDITDEDAQRLKDYINGATFSGYYDTDLMDIITEDAGAFFAGDKSADETAGMIQNRVKTYLGETS